MMTSMLNTRIVNTRLVQNVRAYTTQTAPKKKGSKLWLGLLVGAGIAGGIACNTTETKVKKSIFGSAGFVPLKLMSAEPINHNTKLYRFELPEGHTAGLPVASCVLTRAHVEGKNVVRPYTPVSPDDTEGYVEFVIKKYENGKLTPYLDAMQPGDHLEFKGPMPKYDWEKDAKREVGMIAGGTGITPMLQIIRRVFDEKKGDKKTKISLIFANQTEEDILLKEELDQLAADHPDRFKVVYALDRPSEGWTGHKGYVDATLIKNTLPSPEEEDAIIFVCGPPPMVKSIAGVRTMKSQGTLEGVLKELGYNEKHVFKF